MKRILACGIACFWLGACSPLEDFMDSLFGIKNNVAILASNPFDLSPTKISLSPFTEAKAVGKGSSVCVVLAGGVPSKDSEKEVERLLKGAELSATVTANNGITYEFTRQGKGWAMNGHIVPANEITACVYPICAEQAIPVDTKVLSVAISSSAPVHVLGAYWDSTNAFD